MIENTRNIKIQELAEFIATEQNSTITPLEVIAREENIKIIYDSYEDAFDGISVFDTEYYVHLNTDRGNLENTPRGRFTLAHELGHYFIDSHRQALLNGQFPHPSHLLDNRNNSIEREADCFASSLLMPTERLNNICFKHSFDYSILKKISNSFNVSITAAALRFVEIGNHPICVIFSQNNKPLWYRFSNDFHYKRLLHDKTKIPINTLAGDYFNKGIKTVEETIIDAGDWFYCYTEESKENEIIEKVIIGPNHSVLSIIWE